MNDTICAGEPAVLMAATGGSNGNFHWYSNPSLSNLAYIGNPFIVNGLNADTTFWVVEDDGVCRSDSVRVAVTVLPQPVGDFQISRACFGDSTVFTDNSTGLEAGAQYDIDFENDGVIDLTQAAGSFSYLAPAAGSYTLEVVLRNPSGCTDTFTANYVVDSVPVPAFSADTVCEGQATSFTDLSTVVSPGASYTWDFDGDGSTDATTSGAQSFTFSSAGSFTASLTIKNVSGCQATVSETVVVLARPVPANLSSNAPLCNGDTLNIDATAAGILDYAWTGPNGFTDTVEDITINDVAEADHQGTYQLVVTDSNGCSSDPASIYIEISPIPQTPQASNDGPVCENQAVQLFAGSVPNAIYVWAGPNGFSTTQQNPVIDPVSISDSGVYEVYAEVNGCRSAVQETRLIVHPAPVITAFSDTTIEEGAVTQLDATGGIAYTWSPPEFMSSYDISNPIVSGLPVGTNTIVVTGYNDKLCSATDTVIIIVTQAAEPNIYDVITPNGDGSNDSWFIEFPTGTQNYNIRVYDRGGNEVFSNENNYNNDWDGTRNGKELPEGTYWYIIDVDGNTFSGAITIIR
jgi:gliding motility-associated-like protein